MDMTKSSDGQTYPAKNYCLFILSGASKQNKVSMRSSIGKLLQASK